jgi:FKBP-type peptidyl-prolyl cis-trans isomerase
MKQFTNIIIICVGIAIGIALVYMLYPTMTNSTSQDSAQNGDLVYVHYTGTLTDGTKFDSSLDRGQPFGFVLGAGMVIKGWDEGVLGMKKGEKKKLEISPDKAYGPGGVPDGRGGYIIPPNSALVFDVELIDIKRK